jgi:Thioredoxin-like proteins and domains
MKKLAWDTLKPSIISSINDHFEKNKEPIILKNNVVLNEKDNDEDETILKIKDVLENKVRPAVAKDGGDIQFISFNKGIVNVKLKGSCSGCPSSTMTLKQGVQNLLCHYVKEVKSVEAS